METAETKSAHPSSSSQKNRSPWLWIPSLYFAQGIPYVVVMTMSVIMYKRMGISNTDIALYTSLLNWPWVLKPLWSPFVDIFKTKRQWIIAMQFLIAVALVVLGFSIQATAFFVISLAIFWVMAFSSSTHDIAADGFYMLGLSKHDQAFYVGIRSTFYRAAMIVGSGVLVMLAGYLETKNGLPPAQVQVQSVADAEILTAFSPEAQEMVVASEGESKLVAQPANLRIAPSPRDKAEVDELLAKAKTWNKEHGFYPQEEAAAAAKKTEEKSWWSQAVSEPLAAALKKAFPKDAAAKSSVAGNIGVVYFTLSKPPEKEVVVNFTLDGGDKSIKLVEGERFTFSTNNWNQPFMAVLQLDPKLKTETSATFEARAGDIPLAWSITLIILAGLFIVFCVFHKFTLPRPASDVPVVTGKSLSGEFFSTLGSFFQKPGIIPALLFILLYRFAEAQGVRMIAPFLLDSREVGGLGLTTGQVGFVYGTVGIIALTVGGIIGGILAARYGLKTMLPVMICAIHLPNAAIVYLSMVQPDNFFVINSCIALEQFGYGFGFTAYMLYLLYFADGAHKTAHYAICTGFMALGMMIPGMWSGWLADILGYKNFFIWVMISTIPGFLVAFLVKVDPQFGRKAAKE